MNMKKIILALVLALNFIVCFAQYPLKEGQNQLNAGFGLSTWGLPLYVGFDHGIQPDISVGLEGSFRNYRELWLDDRYNHRVLGMAANCNYHFNRILEMDSSPWDLYGGISLGFFIWSSPSGYKGSHSSGLGLAGQLGARYYFNSNAAINLELGGGSFSGGKFGITFFI